MRFQAVRCPECGAVVMEIAKGLARGKCRRCLRRIWAASDGESIQVGMVDKAPRLLKDGSNRISVRPRALQSAPH